MSVAYMDRIEEFPQDGRLWWIRWVDRYSVPQRGTATPYVEVVLSPLDVSLDKVRNLDLTQTVTATEALRPIRLFTGYIPRLALGAVFQNGVEVASLPLQRMQTNAEGVQLKMLGVLDELSTKPSWWEYPYRVINRSDYYLADYLKSNTVVATSNDLTVVLPCHEIFRTMYAPDSEIALALTSGPWELTKTRVLEPSETGIRTDGRWQIILRKKTRNEFANLLANLCLTETGKAGANGIYTGLLESDGPGYMKVPIPFDISRLQMEARGIWLHGEPRKFLALQITGMTWPLDNETVHRRQNSGDKGEIQTPIDKPKPYSTKGDEPSPDADGIISANSNEDPSATSASTTFSTSDWHIGRTLYGRKRYEEFEAFLTWLAETIQQNAIDALLVAGDVFDISAPSNRAQELY